MDKLKKQREKCAAFHKNKRAKNWCCQNQLLSIVSAGTSSLEVLGKKTMSTELGAWT